MLIDALNYNPTTGEEMRLLNPFFPETEFDVPDQLVQDPNDLNHWYWTYKTVTISAGDTRVESAAIDYNGPIAPDPWTCITSVEIVPPEGALLCGRDPGEPGYAGFGVLAPNAYSTPAVPGVATPGDDVNAFLLYDPQRGYIQPRDASGAGGLRKPSLRIIEVGGTPAQPNYLINTDPDNVAPSNENDFIRDRQAAMVLGKALFWDMQVGSDCVQSCGTCHFSAGADNRTRNQVNPNHLGGDLTFQLHNGAAPNTYDLQPEDFPFHKLADPNIAGDPAGGLITATINAGVLENNLPNGGTVVVNNPANILSDVNDVASSMGVHFGRFFDIPTPGIAAFSAPDASGVRSLLPDLRSPNPADNVDPIPGFAGVGGHDVRRVEPRNTPTIFSAAFNFDNFWDGRARSDFNGGSVFGPSDPQNHVFADDSGTLVATRQIIRFSSLASLATGPGLSNFEMSFDLRNWSKIGKKLLQAGVTPLANQLVDPTDSILGPYSNQRSTVGGTVDHPGRPGLNTSYLQLIQQAYYPALWQNAGQHLDGAPDANDPFDFYSLTIGAGPADPANTSQFTQMEGNFSLFWGLSIQSWVQIQVPDDTPFDRFLDANPGAFASLGEPGEAGLVEGQLNCSNAPGPYCFAEVGHFKRDPNVMALRDPNGEGGGGGVLVPAGGTRQPADPDPLLGLDLFFASNLSLKNPNFRTGRCGECHAVPTLTDNTIPFTFKAQLRDFTSEFPPGQPGVEGVIEPLGRNRLISGFLLESEMNENGQDGVERRIANQSIVPNPVNGLAYPDGLLNPLGPDGIAGTADDFTNAGQSFFDNGVYNIGVRPIMEDVGRGGDDAFGWPLSRAALLLKNLGGPAFEPGNPLPNFDPDLGPTGGLFDLSAQDQLLNPGYEGEVLNPQLPAYLARWLSQINVGDSQPELDEVFGGVNTLTDVALLEGFVDVLGPINPAAVLNEAYNSGESPLMGTWPIVNRVGRMGSFKAAQLRNVELTGPYFHNGGQLTLRQVVDFYTRGGDFPITNAAHRDFNIVNQNIEVQSNLSETEKRALVDFLLELTDDRVRFERAPFDRPQVIVPLDGTAPENTAGRTALLAGIPTGQFLDSPAVGAAGRDPNNPVPAFLGVRSTHGPGPDHYDSFTAANHAPVAAGDSFTTRALITANFPAPGVLVNDTDPDNDPLTAILVAPPTDPNATVTLNADGSFNFRYAQNPTTFVNKTFTYKATDTVANSNTVTVTVRVNRNLPPVAMPDAASTRRNVPVIIPVLNNDFDLQGDPLNPSSVQIVTPPTNGTAVVLANGTIRFTPNNNVGFRVFTYTVRDSVGLISNAGLVIVMVTL
jgi:cytochrome c peroxidase